MQIFKRLRKISAQNLIEFVFVMPILIFITLAIFEVALFWQDLNSVNALNTEINANVALQDLSGMELGTRCRAADSAFKRLQLKDKLITLNSPVYNDSVAIDDPDLVQNGKEPYALYRYKSENAITSNDGEVKPQIQLWVDCRNPFEEGVTTQLEFYHKTLIMKASIPRFDKPEAIVIIPENIFIASPKLNTIKHY